MAKKKWYDVTVKGVEIKIGPNGEFFDEDGNIIDKDKLFPSNSKPRQDLGPKKETKVIPLFRDSTPWKPDQN